MVDEKKNVFIDNEGLDPSNENRVLRILTITNPKRKGTYTYARLAQMKEGQTVDEYLKAASEAVGQGLPPEKSLRRARRTLRKAIREGLVQVGWPRKSI